MTHRAAAALTVLLHRTAEVARAQRGQGTVEYVGLILLIAGALAIVVGAVGSYNAAEIGQTIVKKIMDAIDKASEGKP